MATRVSFVSPNIARDWTKLRTRRCTCSSRLGSRTSVFRTAVTMSANGSRIGFIGLGIMGYPMAQNLIKKRNRELLVWNRSESRSKELADANEQMVKIAASPREVVEKCEIIYSMLSTPEASRAVFFDREDSAISGCGPEKNIIDCSTLTEADVKRTSDAVKAKGGKFLEAPVSGSKAPAENAQLIFVCGGDKEVFDLVGRSRTRIMGFELSSTEKSFFLCVPYFKVEEDLAAMGKKSFFLGDVGAGTKMKLVVNMIMGAMLATLGEGITLAEGAGLDAEDLLNVLDLGAMSNPMFKLKGPKMAKDQRDYTVAFPLEHAQKDMRFASLLADELGISLPVSAAANELFKGAKGSGLSRSDFSAVIEALRHSKNSQ